jgi:multisubunit Na+/H+ antiporter MnhC subunit
MLTMGGPIVNSIIVTSVVLAFATGVVLALVWRRTRPSVYARIGGSEEG